METMKPNPNDIQYIDISNISTEWTEHSKILSEIQKISHLIWDNYELMIPPFDKTIFKCRESIYLKNFYHIIVNKIKTEDGTNGIYFTSIDDTTIKLLLKEKIDGSANKKWEIIIYDKVLDAEDDNERRHRQALVIGYLIPVFNALWMLNCKNIALKDEPEAAVRRMLNKHKKDKKIIYKVLVVNPLKAKTKAEHESIETGIKRSFHLCRGHFRTYTFPNLLFGKLEGTYYIPAHVRGDENVGITHKNYKVVTT